MRKLKKLSKKVSKKIFRNTAKKVHAKNLRKHISRGGYCL